MRADSLQTWKPGELAIIDRQGNVATRAQQRAMKVRAYGGLALLGGSVSFLDGILFHSAATGVIVMAAFGALFGLRMRTYFKLQRAHELLAANRDDEARALLEPLDRRRLRAYNRITVDRALGMLAYRAGRFDDALDRFRRAAAGARAATPPTIRQIGLLSDIACIDILAVTGRVDQARAVRAELPPLTGDIMIMALRGADALIAFHADDPTLLPDDDTLYEWAKAVLATNRFGGLALALAWAFERRGDADMTRLLLDEAPARLVNEHLAVTVPRLHAWADPRLAKPPE